MRVVLVERDGVFEDIVLADAAREWCKTDRTVRGSINPVLKAFGRPTLLPLT